MDWGTLREKRAGGRGILIKLRIDRVCMGSDDRFAANVAKTMQN
jgi:hypothetical protein